MTLTPDRKPGAIVEDEEIQFGANASAATIAGAMGYDGSNLVGQDAQGKFVLRQLTAAGHPALRQLVHLAEGGGPFEGFATGAYQEMLPAASLFPASFIWWTSSSKTAKIVELALTYNTNKTINTEVWKVYATDGTTVLATVTDTWAYSGIFQTSRTRTVA